MAGDHVRFGWREFLNFRRFGIGAGGRRGRFTFGGAVVLSVGFCNAGGRVTHGHSVCNLGVKKKEEASRIDLIFFSPFAPQKIRKYAGMRSQLLGEKCILTFQFLASFKFAGLAFRLGVCGGVFLLKRGPRGGNFTGIHVAVDFGLTSKDVLLKGRDWKNTDLVRHSWLQQNLLNNNLPEIKFRHWVEP